MTSIKHGTAISWTHVTLPEPDGRVYKGETWNYTTGCTQISPGCDNCYALTLHNKWHDMYARNDGRWTPGGNVMPAQYAHPFSTVQVLPQRLEQPKHWTKPRAIFVNSMSDWTHNDITDEQIGLMWRTMLECPQHLFMLLTKRAPRMVKLIPFLNGITRAMTGSNTWPENIWLGVTVESDLQRGRLDHLRKVPAAVRFVSYEPALGPLVSANLKGVDWLITGAESGDPQCIRPMNESWVRLARERCVQQGTAFFYKQQVTDTGHKIDLPHLDGRQWTEFPQPVVRPQ